MTSPTRPDRTELLAAGATFGAMVASWATAVALTRAGVVDLSAQALVLAAVLPLTLARVPHRLGWAALVTCPVVALAATEVHALGRVAPIAADAAYVVVLPGVVWARRLGPRAVRLGRLVSLPFVALLITPAPAPERIGDDAPRLAASVLVAIVGAAWVMLAHRLVPSATQDAPAGAPGGGGRARGTRRLAPTTRLALQLAVALAAAFAIGRLVFGVEHGVWVVITAYVVSSGNRGRGDVVLKGAQRLAGALVGVLAAAGLDRFAAPHAPWVVAAIFAVLAGSLAVRPRSYAAWAAGVTAMLALLHGYYGDGSDGLLATRLVAILVGAVLAVGAAWFVAPLRTVDVLRRRWADALRALHAHAEEPSDHHAARVAATHAQLEQLGPTLRAHRRIARRLGPGPHPADVLDAIGRARALAQTGDAAAAARARRAARAVGLEVCGPGRGARGATGPRPPRSPRG